MKRARLDLLLVERGLAESREKAKRLVLAGDVLVDGRPATKAGHEIPVDSALTIRQPERFVGRGGFKLEEAFLRFPQLSARERVCVDIGASTGGFTDCLLQHGAARVHAVDVGKAQLHHRLAADPRVIIHDACNARHLQPGDLPETPSLAVADVSFISLRLILPALDRILAVPADIVALVKPQFEAERHEVSHRGVIRDPAIRQRVVAAIRDFAESTLHWQTQGICESPIRGPAGNVEFLIYWKKPS
ncbi:MAG: TlyA family RNA methyltransferase [Lentisphaerae bacterium]|nr:TlyA family RNA methyltransferase [Lentisphaerota bacterium]